MTEVTTLTEQHVAEARALWEVTEHIGLSGADRPEALEAFLDLNPGFSFAAWDAGRLVGTVLCGHDGRRGYVHHLAVAESHRRLGLGAELLDRCLAKLREAGIRKCHAFVFHESPYGELFWKPRGWERRADLVVYSSPTSHEID